MAVSTLRSVGGSVMMTIPKPVLEGLGLAPNAKVELSIENGRMIVEARAKPRYRLSDLLAQCDLAAAADPDEVAWEAAEPRGQEVL